jgi:catechol 2,3-dioxygenase-like lactoylglutathione lyase family enzyme
MDSVIRHVDCIELFVDDLDAGLSFYRDALGLALLWRSDTTLGLGLPDGLAEVVLQTDRPRMNVDFKVDSVPGPWCGISGKTNTSFWISPKGPI